MTTTMRASAREMRHMVGRYLHARNTPGYTVNAVRDAIMAAQAEGFDAVTEMERVRAELPSAATGFTVTSAAEVTRFDGSGAPALLLAPAFVDELALSLASGRSAVEVTGVAGIELYAALGDYAAIRGIGFELSVTGADSATVAVRSVPRTPVVPAAGASGPAMERVLLEGYEMDADQFWRLFHESNEALTPDSETSRRHAGSQLYDEDGNLIGEVSEETYLHLRNESSLPESVVLA